MTYTRLKDALTRLFSRVITHLSSSTFNIKKGKQKKNTRNENIFSLVSTTAERHQMRKGKKEKQQEQKVFLLVVCSMFLESRLSFPSCVFSVWVLIPHLSQFSLASHSRRVFAMPKHLQSFFVESEREREQGRQSEGCHFKRIIIFHGKHKFFEPNLNEAGWNEGGMRHKSGERVEKNEKRVPSMSCEL